MNKHKSLQQFFKWLMVDEQAINSSPMQRVRLPKTPTKLVPVLRDEDTTKLLAACKGSGLPRRTAIAAPGMRYSPGHVYERDQRRSW